MAHLRRDSGLERKRPFFIAITNSCFGVLWDHSVSGVPAKFCGVSPDLHCELFPLGCSAESHQPAPHLKVIGWPALESQKDQHHRMLLCGCEVDSESSPLPPVPLSWMIKSNHGYECGFTQPHIQYASVELNKHMNFKTFLSSSPAPSVSNRRVKNRKILFTVRELKENREHRCFICVQGNGILPKELPSLETFTYQWPLLRFDSDLIILSGVKSTYKEWITPLPRGLASCDLKVPHWSIPGWLMTDKLNEGRAFPLVKRLYFQMIFPTRKFCILLPRGRRSDWKWIDGTVCFCSTGI